MNELNRRLWSRADAIISVAVFVAAFAAARVAVGGFISAGNQPQYYQGEFAPAALMACGHGFVNPRLQSPAAGFEALISFLSQQRDSLQCSELPPSFTSEPPNLFQGTHRYLMMLATAVWMVTGVSWSALSIISAMLAAVTAALVYLLARTSMGRVLAFAITAIWIMSPLQLEQLPHLRDYAKAPFFMFTLCAVAWIALTRASRGRTVAALAIVGAVLGLGFGFRTDVVSYLPFVLLAVLAFRPDFDRTDLGTRGLAAAAAMAAFMVVASPILAAYQRADNVAHVAMLGLSDPSREWLGLREAPYSFGYLYHDGYLATVIAGYSERLGTLSTPLNLATPDYTKWSDEYYRLLIMTFTGDVLIRAWAAVLAVLQLPFHPVNGLRPAWIDPSLDAMFQVRGALLSWLGALSPFVAASILAIGTSVVSMRLFGLLVLFAVIVPGMTSLQFQYRHVFHLEVLSLFIYGCLLHFVWKVLRRQKELRPPSIHTAVRATAVATGLAAFVVVPIVAARAYQERNVTKLFASYLSAESERIDVAGTPLPEGQVLLAVPLDASEHPAHFVDTNVLSIAVGGEQCDSDRVPLKLQYRAIVPTMDFTRQTIVPVPAANGASTRLLFPVYSSGARSRDLESLRFAGVELAATDEPCIQSLALFKNPETFPLLLESQLLPQWRQLPLYESLRQLESSSYDSQLAEYAVPPKLRPGRRWRSQLLAENSVPTYRSKQVRRLDERGIEIRGNADTKAAYLLTWPYQSRPKGSVFFVEGELFEGGLTVGIQQKEQWVVNLNVLQPGRFRVALQVEETGDYGAVLANIMLRGLYARMNISRYGWLLPPASSP